MLLAHRRIAALLTILVLLSAEASAQTAAEKDRMLLRARKKVAIGVALMVGGISLPALTATMGRSANSEALIAGAGALTTGSMLAWSGARDRRKALAQTSVGVQVGSRNALVIRHVW